MISGREFGSRTGGGGMLSYQQAEIARKERLKALALEKVDLKTDQYILKNHLGYYECKLCLTLHKDLENYLIHTQGKKHITNIARREWQMKQKTSKIGASGGSAPNPMPATAKPAAAPEKVRIGRPGYKIVKQIFPDTKQHSINFEVMYPEVAQGCEPRHRIMSAYEQRVEQPDKNFQYVVFAAEPYETIAFKVPNRPLDKSEDKYFVQWNPISKTYTLMITFKRDIPEHDNSNNMMPSSMMIPAAPVDEMAMEQ